MTLRLAEFLPKPLAAMTADERLLWIARAKEAAAEPDEADEPRCKRCGDAGYTVDRRLRLVDTGPAQRVIPCVCTGTSHLQWLLERSNLGAPDMDRMSFDTFNTQRPQGDTAEFKSLRAALDAAQAFAAKPEHFLTLTGQLGVGKTHLAVSIARIVIAGGRDVFFKDVPSLLDHLRDSYRPGSVVDYDVVFDQLKNIDLLILDDLYTEAQTAWALEKLFQLVNHRVIYRKATVVTTNRDPSQIEQRVASRLQGAGAIVRIKARDIRSTGELEQLRMLQQEGA